MAIDQRTLSSSTGGLFTTSASGTTALINNIGRAGFSIQNQGTGPLFVFLGSGATNNGPFHVILKGGTTSQDGNGASFSMLSQVVYTGTISVAGTLGSFTVLEI